MPSNLLSGKAAMLCGGFAFEFTLGPIVDVQYLLPIVESLVEKYRDIGFESWESLRSADERFNDYSENVDDPEPEETAFWQAHTDVLEIDRNDEGRYAHVSITVYPWGVHSVPPAPFATLIVYDSGVCMISTPSKRYKYVQSTTPSNTGPN